MRYRVPTSDSVTNWSADRDGLRLTARSIKIPLRSKSSNFPRMFPMKPMAKLALTQLRALLVLSGATVLAWGSVVFSEDWPQFRGSNFDGISLEKETVSWPASGPKVVWKVPTQAGFSSFAVADGHVFTLVDRKEHEGCVALDAKTGKELWYQPVGNAKYDHGAGEGDGPRSTPSVDDGHVYIFNKDFVLHCLDAKKGKPVWKKDLGKEYDGQKLHWNNADRKSVV